MNSHGQPEHPIAFLTELVGLGQVSPRNAAIWLRAAGLDPALALQKDIGAKWNLTARHVHNVHRSVTTNSPFLVADQPCR